MRIDAPVPGRRSFGTLNGETVDEVALATPEGSFARVIAWGATLRDLVVAGPGHPRRIVLGLTSLDDYLRHSPHMGAVA
ncbi:MAG TPA: hypothetical protein VEA41_20550, partial [Salinarimonas sp.]|nr:hypothetical protein [Salinarimonas sp.]